MTLRQQILSFLSTKIRGASLGELQAQFPLLTEKALYTHIHRLTGQDKIFSRYIDRSHQSKRWYLKDPD